MKPPNFEYLAPRTLDEGVAALAQHGGRAKVLAGGPPPGRQATATDWN